MAFAEGDAVCVDITVAEQVSVDGYEAMITRDIPDVWVAGHVVRIRPDGRVEVDLAGPAEAGSARFLADETAIRPRLPDGSCNE
jgi:acylphosphatase